MIELVTPNGERWSVPASVYRERIQAVDDFEKQLEVVRIQAAWRDDAGDRWLSSDVLRKWTAAQVGEALALGSRQKFGRLRQLRQLLEDLGDTEFATTVRSLTAVARLQESGGRSNDKDASSIQTIEYWISREVEVLLI